MKIRRNVTSIIMACIILISSAIPVLAAENQTPQFYAETLQSSHDFSVGSNDAYVRVLQDTNGINGAVKIEVLDFNSALYQVDIQMYAGPVRVWTEDNCMKTESSRIFECGANVTDVFVRIKPRMGWITPLRPFLVRVTRY